MILKYAGIVICMSGLVTFGACSGLIADLSVQRQYIAISVCGIFAVTGALLAIAGAVSERK